MFNYFQPHIVNTALRKIALSERLLYCAEALCYVLLPVSTTLRIYEVVSGSLTRLSYLYFAY